MRGIRLGEGYAVLGQDADDVAQYLDDFLWERDADDLVDLVAVLFPSNTSQVHLPVGWLTQKLTVLADVEPTSAAVGLSSRTRSPSTSANGLRSCGRLASWFGVSIALGLLMRTVRPRLIRGSKLGRPGLRRAPSGAILNLPEPAGSSR